MGVFLSPAYFGGPFPFPRTRSGKITLTVYGWYLRWRGVGVGVVSTLVAWGLARTP